MKNRQFIVFALLLACPLLLHGQETSLCGKESCNKGYIRHPWYGKKVGYIGDSITDPGWEPNLNSPVLKVAKDIHKKVLGFFERMVGYHSLCVWSEWTSME